MAILQIQLHSDCLQRNVPITAVLPVEGGDGQPLRTLFLLHGISGSQQDWLANTRVSRYATARRVAVIMPDGANHFYVDTPATDERYGEYIGRELPALCRRLFRLSDRREDTCLGGLSMGGYGALRNALTYPDTFGAVLAFSSALLTRMLQAAAPDAQFAGHSMAFYEALFGPRDQMAGGPNDVEALARRLAATRGVNAFPRLLLRCGESDGLLGENQAYHAFLKELGVRHDFEVEPGNHEWDFWDCSLLRGLEWLEGHPSWQPKTAQ